MKSRLFLALLLLASPLQALGEQKLSEQPAMVPEFRLVGRTLDELAVTWSMNKIKPYRDAIKQFPDVDSCLMHAGFVDSIDWLKIKSMSQFEVCLFHIHSQLGDPERSADWFRRHGFNPLVRSRKGYPNTQTIYIVNANWIVPNEGPYEGRMSPLSGLPTRLRGLAAGGLSVGVTISNGTVTDVGAGYTYK